MLLLVDSIGLSSAMFVFVMPRLLVMTRAVSPPINLGPLCNFGIFGALPFALSPQPAQLCVIPRSSKLSWVVVAQHPAHSAVVPWAPTQLHTKLSCCAFNDNSDCLRQYYCAHILNPTTHHLNPNHNTKHPRTTCAQSCCALNHSTKHCCNNCTQSKVVALSMTTVTVCVNIRKHVLKSNLTLSLHFRQVEGKTCVPSTASCGRHG